MVEGGLAFQGSRVPFTPAITAFIFASHLQLSLKNPNRPLQFFNLMMIVVFVHPLIMPYSCCSTFSSVPSPSPWENYQYCAPSSIIIIMESWSIVIRAVFNFVSKCLSFFGLKTSKFCGNIVSYKRYFIFLYCAEPASMGYTRTTSVVCIHFKKLTRVL